MLRCHVNSGGICRARGIRIETGLLGAFARRPGWLFKQRLFSPQETFREFFDLLISSLDVIRCFSVDLQVVTCIGVDVGIYV